MSAAPVLTLTDVLISMSWPSWLALALLWIVVSRPRKEPLPQAEPPAPPPPPPPQQPQPPPQQGGPVTLRERPAQSAGPLRWLSCFLPPPPPVAVDALPLQPSASTGAAEELLPPVCTPFLNISLEARPALAYPLLRLQMTGEPFGLPAAAEADLDSLLDFAFVKTLSREEPILVMYDFRVGQLPPWAMAKQAIKAADLHAKEWDAQVQGIACVITSSVMVSGFMSMLTKILRPPQPVQFCNTPEEGLAFLHSIREAQAFKSVSGRTTST